MRFHLGGGPLRWVRGREGVRTSPPMHRGRSPARGAREPGQRRLRSRAHRSPGPSEEPAPLGDSCPQSRESRQLWTGLHFFRSQACPSPGGHRCGRCRRSRRRAGPQPGAFSHGHGRPALHQADSLQASPSVAAIGSRATRAVASSWARRGRCERSPVRGLSAHSARRGC